MIMPKKLSGIDILALAAILILGAIHLPFPFAEDQALFMLGALKMDSGGILYRDFWDFKQPAIYQFYFLAGKLFGFSEFGVHAFELLYMTAFAVVLILTLKRYYTHPAIAAAMLLMTVGMYYGVAGAWHITQVEGLVGFPMFLALWLASESPPPGRGRAVRFFLSGVMGGVVVLFKFVFLPILAAFWVTAVIKAVSGDKRGGVLTSFIRICSPAVLGMLLPLGVVLGYYVRYASLDLLYKTYVVYPSHIFTNVPSNPHILLGIRWFTDWSAPLTALAVIGAYTGIFIKRSLISVNLTLWLVVGVFLVFLQHEWWEYHYILLLIPLGALASQGLDMVWQRMKGIDVSFVSKRWHIVLLISLVLLFLPTIGTVGKKVLFLIQDGLAVEKQQRLKFQNRYKPEYIPIFEDVKFLSEPGSIPGDIYVFSNPLYYWLAGRNQAISIPGWFIENYPDDHLERLAGELSAALPPYVFVSDKHSKILSKQAPRILAMIEQKYRTLRQTGNGVWYERK